MQFVNAQYTFKEDEVKFIRNSLLHWYGIHKRDLPWRNSSRFVDKNNYAYAVWVSEIMLQQTRVNTVVDYYIKWIKKWPSVSSLANASEDDVNQLWSGLGYYSRGKRLLEGAQKVTQNYGGCIPTDSTSLMKTISGVGRYTASAIASIAFNEVVGVLDGNVIRVLCRLRAIGGNTATKEVNSHLWALSNTLVDHDHPGDFNQAMMELGALICTPKKPACLKCPLISCCKAYAQLDAHNNKVKSKLLSTDNKPQKDIPVATPVLQSKKNHSPNSEEGFEIEDIENCADFLALTEWSPSLGVENYPQKFAKKAPKTESKIVVILEVVEKKSQKSHSEVWRSYHSKILVSKRPKSGLLANLWEFPNKDQDKIDKVSKKRKLSCSQSCGENEDAVKFVSETLDGLELDDCTIAECNFLGEYVHKFSHIHQTNLVYHYTIVTKLRMGNTKVPTDSNCRWVQCDEFEKLAKPTLTKNIYKLFTKLHDTKTHHSKPKSDVKNKQAPITSFFNKA